MAYDTDEEQLEALKRWWKENGTSLIAGIVIVAAVYFGIGQFQESRRNEAGQASERYQLLSDLALANMTQVIGDQDMVAAQATYTDLKQNFPDSIYTRYGALIMARFHVEQGNLERAAAELQWILDNPELGLFNEADEELFTITSLRLARVKLAQGQPSEALSLIESLEIKDAFLPAYAEIEGDIQLALGNRDAARASYERALAALQESGTGNPVLLQMKLYDLGVDASDMM